jgi:putative restriction endonuclease
MFYHKKNEVRLKVQTDENGSYQFIDVSITRYESLPEIEYLENGEYNVILNKIPYPNGREWQEIEIKKPLRKQDKFRKEILLKYNSCCCVCDIKDKSLLRAAHILAVADGGLDEISNGILLCVNHEIAFDKGLLKILPNYEIEAPNDIGVNVSSLKLPKADIDYPSPVLLEQKMALFNK